MALIQFYEHNDQYVLECAHHANTNGLKLGKTQRAILDHLATGPGVTRQTVSKWVGDIVEHRRNVRQVIALLLTRAGWSQTQVADHLGVAQKTVSNDVKADILTSLTEELLREASAGLPDSVNAESLIEELRQERIFASWSDDERELLKQLRSGETVVVTLRGPHNSLIEWADAATAAAGPFVGGMHLAYVRNSRAHAECKILPASREVTHGGSGAARRA